MKQTIPNACGTIAILHSVYNNLNSINMENECTLKSFFEETKESSPSER
jgi:ubiquitin carboxyl-terminal hydrolase L3